MALYAIYIGRVSGLNDFVLGSPILNRSNSREKNTPGMFISTVAFRFILNKENSFVRLFKKLLHLMLLLCLDIKNIHINIS